MRIASLLPSATEVVYALGAGDDLVGRSPECDHPPEVAAKPVLSVRAFDGTRMASPEIDAAVRRQMAVPGGSLYHVDADALRAARPDLILTQNLCDVCAATVDEVRAAATALDPRPEVVTLTPSSLEDILEDILRIGGKVGRLPEAKELVASLRERLNRVRRETRGIGTPRVACIEWFDPIFNAGHWVPEQVECAGGREVLGTAGAMSRRIPWESVLAARPDVLVLMACGFDVPRAMEEVRRITGRPGYGDLPAAREGRVFVVNGSAYFNRPGPRTVDGVELLAHVLHPERFPDPWPESAVRRLS